MPPLSDRTKSQPEKEIPEAGVSAPRRENERRADVLVAEASQAPHVPLLVAIPTRALSGNPDRGAPSAADGIRRAVTRR